ncbi:SIMPL domain-containing protein [Neobacillus sp. YIM B06451]|uniref:SIMPL domain-containing protein n=1 Tax=Neobacillus sp. YIM B06451 TaxID=3070994 RepID=UPI0029302DE3|nr:SIMPL domain-containing protein [Neobacillus sp. YIM B06451]
MSLDTERAATGKIIRVKGEGMVTTRPDLATVVIGVSTEQKDVAAGQQQNARDSSRVVNALLGLGIPTGNIRTFDYRIESMYDFKEGMQIFRGYKITHLLQVKVTDLEKAGTVIDTAVRNGANYVSDIHFTASKQEAYYKEALTLAVQNAYEKAKTIGMALGVKLNPVPVSVIEGNDFPRPVTEYHTPMVKGISTTQIQPGKLTIEAAVISEYHIDT